MDYHTDHVGGDETHKDSKEKNFGKRIIYSGLSMLLNIQQFLLDFTWRLTTTQAL